MKVINLFAGPGAGKSTTATGVFSKLKQHGVNCEYVSEYAKAAVWEKRHNLLADQLYISAKQNRWLDRLRRKVDVVVTDAPLLLGLHYKAADYFPETFEKMLWALWNSYENTNFFINRHKPYSQVGRMQNEEEAKEIDKKIWEFLIDNGIGFSQMPGNEEGIEQIARTIVGY